MILSGNVNARIQTTNRDLKLSVQNLLSYSVNGAEHTTSFQNGTWDGRSTMFDFHTGNFPAGFTDVVIAHLRKQGFDPLVRRKPLPAPLGPKTPIIDHFPADPRYFYQPKAMRELESRGRMIARVATGGGKSRIANLCVARIKRPTLFLTTRSVLMHQMKGHFEKALKVRAETEPDVATWGVGIIGDSEYAPRKNINVATIQTIAAHLKEPDPRKSARQQKIQREKRQRALKLLAMIEFVILEEAHEASGDQFYQVLQNCKNAAYRLSLTATPFMKENDEDNFRLMGASGEIGIEVTEKYLIDCGILATPKFEYVDTVFEPDRERIKADDLDVKQMRVGMGTGYQRANKLGITYNLARNRIIQDRSVTAASDYSLSVLILVKQKVHGRIIKEMINEAAPHLAVEYIFGESSKEKRQACLNDLSSGKLNVLIGSTILDVGVDVPSIDMVILAGGGKAEVALRQRVGRGLREKKKGPNVAFILDFMDNFNRHLRGHSVARRAIIDSTPGFSENILLGQTDFEKFGHHRAVHRAA